MSTLIFPEVVRIQLTTWENDREVPAKLSNIIFCIYAFVKRKKAYHLAPFFSNEDGIVIHLWKSTHGMNKKSSGLSRQENY